MAGADSVNQNIGGVYDQRKLFHADAGRYVKNRNELTHIVDANKSGVPQQTQHPHQFQIHFPDGLSSTSRWFTVHPPRFSC